ncbi:MAG: transglutaminase family protein [Candidatus Thiodiazotropha sp. 6PLUC7]
MQRYSILHRTYYTFSEEVILGPHRLRLRPREGHELRIESSTLEISPSAELHWQRDAEDNSVTIATFDQPASQLVIESKVIIQQYNESPLDFLVSDYAINFPFDYTHGDRKVLSPYLKAPQGTSCHALKAWIDNLWQADEKLQSYELILRLTRHINQAMRYQIREEPGVQTAENTLALGSGSCRDFAALLMEAARELGLAARFVSGYLCTPPSPQDYGATHAWTEIYLPGPGWKGFDPTTGEIVGSDHVSVAVSHSPADVPPVEGSYVGPGNAKLEVGVWMTPL